MEIITPVALVNTGSSSSVQSAVVRHEAEGKNVLIYKTATNRINAAVIKDDNTLGTPASDNTFSYNHRQFYKAAQYDPYSEKIIVIGDESSLNVTYAIITVSGDSCSISVQTVAVTTAPSSYAGRSFVSLGNGKFIGVDSISSVPRFWIYNVNPSTGVLTFAGYTNASGFTDCYGASLALANVGGNLLLISDDAGSSDEDVVAQVGTVSGATISWGSRIELNADNGQVFDSFAIGISATEAVVIYEDYKTGAGDGYRLQTLAISGTSVAVSESLAYAPYAYPKYPSLAHDSSTGRVAVCTQVYNDSIVISTHDLSDLTDVDDYYYVLEETVNIGAIYGLGVNSVAYDSTNNRLIGTAIAYEDGGSTPYDVYLYGLEAVFQNFWTNFRGQTERE